MATQFDVSLDESVQVLKQVLPLMSKQRVPTIPQNYAVWYDFVTKDNPELVGELENHMQQGDDFDARACRNIYEKYFLAEMRSEVTGIQGAVREAVESVLQELGGLGDDINHFSGVLDACGISLQQNPTAEDLNKLVVELVRETTRTKSRSMEVEGSLRAMGDELTELRVQVDRLSKDSRTDALTRIANRRAFDEAIKRMSGEAGKSNTPLCLILCDIDHFKDFNDKHGHVMGDRALHAVAQEMEQCVKGRDLLARYGGEEFAILLPSTPYQGAMMLADSIRSIVETQSMRNDEGEEIDRVSISLGVAEYAAGEELSDFVERADRCLYASKANGRNRTTGEKDLNTH